MNKSIHLRKLTHNANREALINWANQLFPGHKELTYNKAFEASIPYKSMSSGKIPFVEDNECLFALRLDSPTTEYVEYFGVATLKEGDFGF